MFGWLSNILWVSGVLAALYVAGRSIVSGDFLRYPILTIYMAAQAAMDISSVLVLRRYGLHSEQYAFHYYYLGSLLTVAVYFVVVELFQHAFHELGTSRHIRVASIVAVAAIAALAFAMVEKNTSRLTSRFVVAFSQNIYFAGVALTYMLWTTVLRLREMRTRLAHLVLALGISFTAVTAVYALGSLFPPAIAHVLATIVVPAAGTFLPVSWAYTFTRIPEEARVTAAVFDTPLAVSELSKNAAP
jgi:hypothetical protein